MNDALRVYSWDDIASGAFLSPEELAAAGYEGTALTVGGFDGVHLGHQALFFRCHGPEKAPARCGDFRNLTKGPAQP